MGNNAFFEHPILNSPYEYWELNADGQPTQQIVDTRRPADFMTPIPKPKRRGGQAAQGNLDLGGDQGLSDEKQQYAQAEINRLSYIATGNRALFPLPALVNVQPVAPRKGMTPQSA